MYTLDLNPKTKTDLSSHKLNWVVCTPPQAFTYEEVNGDLAEEISAVTISSKIETDPIPSIEPEDFETAYQWFIS